MFVIDDVHQICHFYHVYDAKIVIAFGGIPVLVISLLCVKSAFASEPGPAPSSAQSSLRYNKCPLFKSSFQTLYESELARICYVKVCSFAAAVAGGTKRPIVEIQSGRLRGTTIRDKQLPVPVQAFLGIPYAQPAVGDLRLAAPQPVTPWKGTRDATQYGNEIYKWTAVFFINSIIFIFIQFQFIWLNMQHCTVMLLFTIMIKDITHIKRHHVILNDRQKWGESGEGCC